MADRWIACFNAICAMAVLCTMYGALKFAVAPKAVVQFTPGTPVNDLSEASEVVWVTVREGTVDAYKADSTPAAAANESSTTL